LLFIRSFISVILLAVILNVKLKEYMCDKVERKYAWQLALRVGIGVFNIICIYTSVKSLPLVYVGVVMNLSPLLTALLSYFLFKKGLSPLDASALLASFTGVLLLITGASQQQ
jgi:drug/metabolite transporter (DMT)-like permease